MVGHRKELLEALAAEFKSINFLLISGNVACAEDLDRVVATVTDAWGELDTLINNAGVVSASLLTELGDEDVISQISIDVEG